MKEEPPGERMESPDLTRRLPPETHRRRVTDATAVA